MGGIADYVNFRKRQKAQAMTEEDQHSQSRNWYHLDVELWHAIVHIYIGDRRSMVMTMPQALDDYGHSKERIKTELNTFRENHHDYLNLPPGEGEVRKAEKDIFVRLDSFSYNVADIAVAAHEFLHAANIILRDVNLIGDSNVEGLAYTQEYLFSEFLKRFIDRNNPENHIKTNQKKG